MTPRITPAAGKRPSRNKALLAIADIEKEHQPLEFCQLCGCDHAGQEPHADDCPISILRAYIDLESRP